MARTRRQRRRNSFRSQTSVPGRTNGGTNFDTVANTPGQVTMVNGVPTITPAPTPPAATPPAAPPAAPPPAPAPPRDYGNPTPDSAFELQSRAALTGRDNSLSSIAAQRTALNEAYGFDANTGTFAENVDVTNPYSRAALLNKSFARARKGSEIGYANRGALTSGAYAAALRSDADAFNQNKKGLEQDFAARRADFLAQENAANLDYESKMADLRQQLMERRMAQDAPVYTEADNPASPTPAPSPIEDFLKRILETQKPKPKPKRKPKGKR